MIKKFTTFFASMVALLALSFNAAAQSSAVPSLEEGLNKGVYMLALDYVEAVGNTPASYTGLLSVDADGQLVIVPDASSADFQNQLWCVDVARQVQGNYATFQFVNQGASLPLSLSIGDFGANPATGDRAVVNLGGELGEWAFSENFSDVSGLEKDMPLTLYYDLDKMIALVYNNVDGTVEAEILAPGTKRAAVEASSTYAKFTLVNVDDIVLTQEQFNTVLKTQAADKGVSLVFTEDVAGGFVNPFNQTAILAEDSGDPIVTTTYGTGNYQYITKVVNGTTMYLGVAKKYTNDDNSSVKNLDWEWVTADKLPSATTEPLESGRFKFILTYSFAEDNLYIQVKNVFKETTDNTDVDADGNPNWYVFTYTNGTPLYDLYITTVDLTNNTSATKDRLVTVNWFRNAVINNGPERADQIPTISFISFGCDPKDSNRTTIADGIYKILNSAGRYLASPIYRDGAIAEYVPVDLEGQNPDHMPAYQWVVLKVVENSDYSAVTITNREYPNANLTYTIRVTTEGKKDSDGNIIYQSSSARFNNVRFVKVGNDALNNPKLGYAYFADDSLLVSRYTFRYFNPYDQDQYVSYNGNTFTALGGRDAFKLDRASMLNNNSQEVAYVTSYGFDVENNVNISKKELQKRIPGLVQLERAPYTITLPEKGRYAHVLNDTYYGVNGAANATPIYVYLKENNHWDDRHYYSFVEVGSSLAVLGDVKAGISDDNLGASMKIEKLSESRTSSFSVIADDRPLYRRFNGVGENRTESDGDRRDTLEFYEYYRGEVLGIETNPKFSENQAVADILGIDYKNEFLQRDANAKFGFVVDTAWVKRGRGVVKPQYLISIERNDFLGSEETLCPIDPSPEHQAVCHHYRPAIPAFNRGKYLVNYEGLEDYIGGAHFNEIYRWNDKYNRAGFVHAIHRGDSLYVLLADKYDFYSKDLTNETIDFATIVKEGEATYADETKRPVKIFPLTGDNHKYVTWSMRYIDPDNYLEDPRFLMESMKWQITGTNAQPDIAPTYAEWLKSNNGVLVLSDAKESTFDKAQTGGDDALIFDVTNAAEAGVATDNDKVTTTEVKVIASEGKVTVLNAAGKKVVVSNVLGQTVANTVLSSDNASIAAPKGIVVVAVEGEDAVKAIVK